MSLLESCGKVVAASNPVKQIHCTDIHQVFQDLEPAARRL
jgi:hypothetical protein